MAWKKTIVGKHIVSIEPDPELYNRENKWGTFFCGKKPKIFYEPQTSEAHRMSIIVHEDLHAICEFWNIRLTHKLIEQLEIALSQYLQDNYRRIT